MSKKRIMFVDDEPNILDGLRRMLRSLRNEYDMAFAAGGREALSIMEEHRFDVVVSDMRMPGMDGAQLLEEIQRKHPYTIRMMLTGQADEEAILRTVGIAHQFLAKPCDPERLKKILIQTSALQDILSDGGLKALISKIGSLPSLPSTYAKMQKAIASPNVEIHEVAEIISQDIAMTAKVLQLVNSSFFGVYSHVDTARRAVTLLGLETLKALVLGLELFSQISLPENIFRLDQLWEHSLMVGKLSKSLAIQQSQTKEEIGNTFLAGTLHDLGRLVLLTSLPDQYREAVELANTENINIVDAESAIFGASQSAVASYLLGIWGFSIPIIEAIGFHNNLDNYPATGFSSALALHVANILYYQNRPKEIIGRALELNMPVINRMGLQQNLGTWGEICAGMMNTESSLPSIDKQAD